MFIEKWGNGLLFLVGPSFRFFLVATLRVDFFFWVNFYLRIPIFCELGSYCALCLLSREACSVCGASSKSMCKSSMLDLKASTVSFSAIVPCSLQAMRKPRVLSRNPLCMNTMYNPSLPTQHARVFYEGKPSHRTYTKYVNSMQFSKTLICYCFRYC